MLCNRIKGYHEENARSTSWMLHPRYVIFTAHVVAVEIILRAFQHRLIVGLVIWSSEIPLTTPSVLRWFTELALNHSEPLAPQFLSFYWIKGFFYRSAVSFSLHPFYSPAPTYFRQTCQGLRSWFQNEFLANNKKMEAVRQMDGCSPAFELKESVERRLLSSVCHDYGTNLTAKFFRELTTDERSKRILRKSASDLLWSYFVNLHPHGARKVSIGGQVLSLKAVCSAMVSKAITIPTNANSVSGIPILRFRLKVCEFLHSSGKKFL